MRAFAISKSLASRLLGLYVEKGIVQKADVCEKITVKLHEAVTRSFFTSLAVFICDLQCATPFELCLMKNGAFHRFFRQRAASPYMLHDARGEVLFKVLEREFLAWAQGYGIMYGFGVELPVGSLKVSGEDVSMQVLPRATLHAPGYAFE